MTAAKSTAARPWNCRAAVCWEQKHAGPSRYGMTCTSRVWIWHRTARPWWARKNTAPSNAARRDADDGAAMILWRYRDIAERARGGPIPPWLLYVIGIAALINFLSF